MYCKIIAGVWVALLACLFCTQALAMGKAPDVSEKTFEAVDFELMDLDGKIHSLSEYQGKKVFLNFWASWCAPCRAEMPSMQKLYESWDQDKFEMLAVNVGESKETAKSFAEKNGYTFTILLDQDKYIAGKYLLRGLPTTFLIDEKGEVIARIFGTREWTLEMIQGLIE